MRRSGVRPRGWSVYAGAANDVGRDDARVGAPADPQPGRPTSANENPRADAGGHCSSHLPEPGSALLRARQFPWAFFRGCRCGESLQPRGKPVQCSSNHSPADLLASAQDQSCTSPRHPYSSPELHNLARGAAAAAILPETRVPLVMVGAV